MILIVVLIVAELLFGAHVSWLAWIIIVLYLILNDLDYEPY